MSSPIIMSLHSLETSESSLLAAKMHSWDLPLHSTAPWTLPQTLATQETPSPNDPTTTGRAGALRVY